MDAIQKLLFKQANARGQTATIDESYLKAFEHQPDVPRSVRRLAGEVAVAALLIEGALQLKGSVLLQIAGSGPLEFLMAEARDDFSYRITVRMKKGAEASSIKDDASLSELVNVDGAGRCGLVLDPADRPREQQPYVALVPLVGETFSEALESYFKSSEQVETTIRVAADEKSAGGVMVQKMPSDGGSLPEDYDAEGWSRIKLFVESVKTEELLELPASEIDRRLFWEENPLVTMQAEPSFRCSCSEEKMLDVIHQMGRETAMEMLDDKGVIEVSCDFCGRRLELTKEQVEKLFE